MSRGLSADWRDQIGAIITETERNLGIKVTVRAGSTVTFPSAGVRMPLAPVPMRQAIGAAPLLSSMTTAATTTTTTAAAARALSPPLAVPAGAVAPSASLTAATIAAANAAADATAKESAEASYAAAATSAASTAACSTAAAAVQGAISSGGAAVGPSATTGGASSQQVLDAVKFELDLRASLQEKALAAVREEMSASTASTEKKWVEIAKAIETNIGGQLDAEAKLRQHSERALAQLRDAASTAHQETLRVVGEFQQTAIDHSEVLRRLDAEVTSMRQGSEQRLAEEAIKVQQIGEGQKQLARLVEGLPSSVAAAASHEPRLAELEAALLQEREFRRRIDEQLTQLRQQGVDGAFGAGAGASGAGAPAAEAGLGAEHVESIVLSLLEQTGHGGSIVSLDEKVKECGRLIVRMGTELMEETKRRQTLEAEVQELRMRLSGVEAVARSPLQGASGLSAAAAVAAGDGGGAAEYIGGFPYGAPSYGVPGGDAAFMQPAYTATAPPVLGGGDDGGLATPYPAAAAAAAATAPAAGGGSSSEAAEAADDAASARLGGAVEAKLRELVPGAATPAATLPAATEFGLPAARRTAAQLRVSQGELDARVAQILGKHGQALAMLGAGGGGAPKPP